jgi:hypothetical protein
MCPVLSQHQPHQSEMLELAKVAEIVLHRELALIGPADRVTEPALTDPQACPYCRHGPHVGGEVAHIQQIGLVEQLDCGLQISFSLPYASHRDPPPVPVLW